MSDILDLKHVKPKEIYSLGEDFRGENKIGEELSFTNYYMLKNGEPFFGISGEFHYARMSEDRWEDELIKMKMCGINVVSTYVFWIHHEEEEGTFRFDGCRNLRRFVELCSKHGLYVILRVGPFAHGEVRNGGIPDWMYGKPFETRKLSEGYLECVRRFYAQVGQQAQGLFFRDNGPVIGVQIDNEYMHSAAPWEVTTGISNEWIFRGDEGNEYMLQLKELAVQCGLTPAFYTCTGWGGAATPESMVPLWGGYAFRPWLFYSYKGEHPATEEYVYQDYHNNDAVCTSDFDPSYEPESRPYSCCEMGGGMMCSYYYRFQLPYKSVDAMANIKLGSGCNFLGYYMFHGGSNPVGIHGTFLNESQVSKISYDYQAALGEYGQERESYRRLKNIHYFLGQFGTRLCKLGTVLPQGASDIAAKDATTMRYAVRTDGERGFLFLNNYQDHFDLPERENEEITLQLPGEDLTWKIGIASEENAILPFHFDVEGMDLVQANAQPMAKTTYAGESTYIFFVPNGMQGGFRFEKGTSINGTDNCEYRCAKDLTAELFTVERNAAKAKVLVIDRSLADQMFLLTDGRLVFTEEALLESEEGIRLETIRSKVTIHTYPADAFADFDCVESIESDLPDFLGSYQVETRERRPEIKVEQVDPGRYTIAFPKDVLEGVKDARLQLEYTGDIGNAFINGRLIHDNFSNGAVWEIGLKDFAQEIKSDCITIYIVPLKKGANVNVESAMAARSEEVKEYIAELKQARVQPVYEMVLSSNVR